MKKILLLVGHPEIESSCNSKAFINSVKGLNNVKVHDFDPADINVDYEHKILEESDVILCLSPMMWFSYSSKLQRYFEEVFNPGWSYTDTGDGFGALRGKIFSVILTTAASAEVLDESKMLKYTSSLESIAEFCGMIYRPVPAFHGVYFPTQSQLKSNTEAFLNVISSLSQ